MSWVARRSSRPRRAQFSSSAGGLQMATATSDGVRGDPIEMLYERGVTDGLPVVPPTRERVDRMLARVPWRRRDELIGVLGPQMGRATVEKVAVNAVMAG